MGQRFGCRSRRSSLTQNATSPPILFAGKEELQLRGLLQSSPSSMFEHSSHLCLKLLHHSFVIFVKLRLCPFPCVPGWLCTGQCCLSYLSRKVRAVCHTTDEWCFGRLHGSRHLARWLGGTGSDVRTGGAATRRVPMNWHWWRCRLDVPPRRSGYEIGYCTSVAISGNRHPGPGWKKRSIGSWW